MKKKTNKKRFRGRHLLLVLFSLYLITTFISQQKTMRELKAEKLQKEKDIISLEKEIKQLDNKKEHSDSLEFVEKVARDELNMVKPREIIYIDRNKNKNPFFNQRNNEN